VLSSSSLLPLVTMLRWLLTLTRSQERISSLKNAVLGLQRMVDLAITVEEGVLAEPVVAQTDEPATRDVEVFRRGRMAAVEVTDPGVVGVGVLAMSLRGVDEVPASPAANLIKKGAQLNRYFLWETCMFPGSTGLAPRSRIILPLPWF
jgi:hypothetical protein